MPIKKRFNVPYLGFGLGLRTPYFQNLLNDNPPVDWLELISENFMLEGGRSLYMLDQFKERYRLIPHGVSLSIGASDPLDWDYLRRLKQLIQRIKAPWFSDHLCWSQEGGAHMHNLLPLIYTPEIASFVAEKIRIVQDFMEIPFLVENVSSYVEFKSSELTEWEFLRQVVEKADCGILLDINNIYVSARNHNFDPFTYLHHMPADRVIQYHIAGHDDRGTYILDSHDHPVRADVWALYAHAVPLFGDVSLMLERDEDIPPLPELLDELDHARSIHAKATKNPIAPPLLKDLQRWMSAAIQNPVWNNDIHQEAANRLTASSTLSSEERLNIYLNDYWPRCLGSLRDDFPKLLEHWGNTLFSEWMVRYLQKRPSQSFTLFHLPEGLPAFMETDYHASDREFVLRLVNYEWAKNKAYFAKQEHRFEPLALSEMERSQLPNIPLSLQPHVSLVLNPIQDQNPIVVYRQDHKVEEESIDAILFRVLICFEKSMSLSDAIETVTANSMASDIPILENNTQSWFQRIVERGWLVHPIDTLKAQA
jgi:uncharacterized protein (UPF0276 family)